MIQFFPNGQTFVLFKIGSLTFDIRWYAVLIMSGALLAYLLSKKEMKESRYVSMKYSDFKFIGFWQAQKPGTPYVCLEPWSALPAIDGAIVELETKPHMTRVGVGEKAAMSFTVTVHE